MLAKASATGRVNKIKPEIHDTRCHTRRQAMRLIKKNARKRPEKDDLRLVSTSSDHSQNQGPSRNAAVLSDLAPFLGVNTISSAGKKNSALFHFGHTTSAADMIRPLSDAITRPTMARRPRRFHVPRRGGPEPVGTARPSPTAGRAGRRFLCTARSDRRWLRRWQAISRPSRRAASTTRRCAQRSRPAPP